MHGHSLWVCAAWEAVRTADSRIWQTRILWCCCLTLWALSYKTRNKEAWKLPHSRLSYIIFHFSAQFETSTSAWLTRNMEAILKDNLLWLRIQRFGDMCPLPDWVLIKAMRTLWLPMPQKDVSEYRGSLVGHCTSFIEWALFHAYHDKGTWPEKQGGHSPGILWCYLLTLLAFLCFHGTD